MRLAAKGKQNKDMASELGLDRSIVGRWRSRFAQQGLAGIEKDAPGGGRKPTRRNELARWIIKKTTQETPRCATHWSRRSLAKKLGLSQSMVHRVWKANGLKPHLARTFKVSNDPDLVEQWIDVVGLYLDPPEHALVLCADEKSQIQALDRTPPGLPLKKGRCGTMTHDYKTQRHNDVVRPLELAEGWLREITEKRIRRGTFTPVKQLQQAITGYLDEHNQNPKAFKWTAKAETILQKVRRARAVLDKMQTA